MSADNNTTRPAGAEAEPDTAVVAEQTSTEAAMLAWSVGDAAPELDEGAGPERRPLPRSLLILLASVIVSAIGLAAFMVGDHLAHRGATAPAPPPATTTSTSKPAPPPSASPPPPAPPPGSPATTPPPPPPQFSGVDARFLAYIHDNRVPYRSGDADAIDSAHQVCEALSWQSLAAETASVQRALGWSYEDSATFVSGAVGYYCPQYAPAE